MFFSQDLWDLKNLSIQTAVFTINIYYVTISLKTINNFNE